MKIALAIPTYNAGEEFSDVLSLINKQSERINTVKIVDSSSVDNTVKIAREFNYDIQVINQVDFSHGGTRREISIDFYNKGYDYLIFMTQDVYLQENALDEIITYIKSDENLGVAFGKQEVDLRKGNLFEYYARTFNYPSDSYIRTSEDIVEYGIKAIFSSDAFAIYNLHILKEVDFFENTNDVSEDMLVAHKIIKAGYSVGYCSDARVFHTHNYSVKDEYKRYKEIGKFYRNQNNTIKNYEKTSSNGIKLVIGEIKFLLTRKKVLLVPKSIARNTAKYIGYKSGYYNI